MKMDLQKEFEKEKGYDCFVYRQDYAGAHQYKDGFSDDYVEWLESKVNNVVSDDVKVELPIKKVEVNFNGDLLAEIEIQNNTLKVLRAVNGGGYMVDCKKVSIKEK